MTLFEEILATAKQENYENRSTISDLLNVCKNVFAKDKIELGLKYTNILKLVIDKKIKERANIQYYYDTYFKILVLETPYSFDSYFRALEWNRPVHEQFYLPRRKVFQRLGIIQKLEDLLIWDKLDELFLSFPPRTGKTTLANFIVSWLVGLKPELSNLYCSCSGQLATSFFKGVQEILTDSATYNWQLIFPTTKYDRYTYNNAKECYFDTGRIKRYHSFTGRSIDSESLNGSCNCDGLLIGDDLCSGIEEAMNKERLFSLNLKVNNNLLTRAKMNAKILWIGTRWSIADPIAIRLLALETTKRRFEVMNCPALNDNGESNFEYLYNVGFSTQYFQERKASFESNSDTASWLAQYMGEPVERSGLLFDPDTLNYYNGMLPTDNAPERIFGFCDIAWGGGDYVVLPVLYKINGELYCPEFVCDNGDKTITQPKVAECIYRNRFTAARFEKNSGGDEYARSVEKILKDKYNYTLNIQLKSAPNQKSKEQKIFDKAPDIRNIKFLTPEKRTPEYQRAMNMLVSFTMQGKNKNDDVPDALAGSVEMDQEIKRKVAIEIFQRLF